MISETFLPVPPLGSSVFEFRTTAFFIGKTVLPQGNTVYLSFITCLFNFVLDCIKILVHTVKCHVPVVHSKSDVVKIL